MAREIPAPYDTIASQVIDRLVEFGEARVSNVPDTALLRAASGELPGAATSSRSVVRYGMIS